MTALGLHNKGMRALCTALLVFSGLTPVAAQQTREEQIASEQAEKATRLHPYEPNRVEAIALRATRPFAGPPRGLYPWLGNIYSGGWLAVGPGLRLPYRGGGVANGHVAVSLKGYWAAGGEIDLPPMADGRARIKLNAGTLDATKVSFFGVGNDSRSTDKTSFRYQPTTAGATLAVKPVRFVEAGAALSLLDIETARGKSSPSIEERFTPETAPGLGESPSYIVATVHGAFDWRPAAGYARRGGYYAVDWTDYHQRDGDRFDFRRVDVDLRQHIPILRENWIIALRAATSVTFTDDDADVPYFLMPQLGGSSTLRGFSSWRFRDRHRVLFTVEYRWTPSHFVDMAVFHDAGKVTGSRGQINFRQLTHSNGIGIRFHTPAATVLRFELAHGREGFKVVIAFSPIY
jgi:hypothetical protein